ncbi:hypothetical protein [Methylobrevis pamukkalensis]|uniref:Uncharacterized protein n=1 Tax=Methylobrevis pamukkalensis TaxID=1439726 RepID=A0A1E3H9L3_9HYPH|nr:hypothetical protein [Methylobrevis pamukkalensis]ODN72476.1 hypothetical protein A6302_00222 [Methylobrevis pamukkalensis]
MELSLPVVIGAAVGLGVGILDYGIVAAILRKFLAGRRSGRDTPPLSDGRHDFVFKVLFVVNAVAFAGLGAFTGAQLAGYGL